MVRPDRDEHAWERLCARKRDEIERDTRLLSEQQEKRCERAERLYAELESAHAHTVTEENDVCEDGVLDLRGKELKVFTVPAAVERTLATRTIHTLILRNNRLQHLDARTLAPLIALVKLDVSRNELERLGPTGAVTIPGDHAKVLAAHPGARAAGVKGGFPPRLEVLLAAFNRVQKLSLGAAGAPCLKRLVVAHNVVRFVAPDIAKAPNLEELDLRGNRLAADQLKHLAPLKKLATVKVGRNPLCADRRHGHAVPSHVRNALSTTKAPPAAPRRAWAAPAAAAARRRGDGARPAPAPAPPSLLPRDATPASAFAASAFGASAFGAPAAPAARAPAPAPAADPFSSAASAFGAPVDPAASAFGAPTPPAASSAFGAPTPPAASSAFGAPTPPAASDPFAATASSFGAADPFAAAASTFADPFAASAFAAPAPAPAAAQSLRDRLIAKGAVDTLPRKPQTPASESSEEESSDESGSEYSEDGPDWIEGWDPNHKHVYYFNHVTEVTTWARPRDAEVRPMSAKDAARRREDLLNK